MEVLHALERFTTIIGNAIRGRNMANYHSKFYARGLGKYHTDVSKVVFYQHQPFQPRPAFS